MAGMRLKDYIERLTKEEYEEVFGNIEKEEKKLRAFLGKLDEHLLDPVATMLNDTFDMPADDFNVTDFIVELYKCQKADFLWASLLKEDAFDWGLLHLVQGRPLYSSSYRDLTSCAGTTLTLSWFGVLALIGLEAPFVVSTPVCSDYCFLFPH